MSTTERPVAMSDHRAAQLAAVESPEVRLAALAYLLGGCHVAPASGIPAGSPWRHDAVVGRVRYVLLDGDADALREAIDRFDSLANLDHSIETADWPALAVAIDVELSDIDEALAWAGVPTVEDQT